MTTSWELKKEKSNKKIGKNIKEIKYCKYFVNNIWISFEYFHCFAANLG